MGKIITYLSFNGNCREAMTFYQKCLGGTLQLQTVEDSPVARDLPRTMKDCILHATLVHGQLILSGTDMVGESGLQKGNAVSMLIDCSSEKEIRTYFSKLSHERKAATPISKNHWGALFGEVLDQYGNHWLLQFKD